MVLTITVGPRGTEDDLQCTIFDTEGEKSIEEVVWTDTLAPREYLSSAIHFDFSVKSNSLTHGVWARSQE